jgi:branched-chain amino acid transport system ATP-binding protein
MTTPLLCVKGLNAFYGAAQILFDVSFEVARGEVVALMGRNGAGKSTTMKAVMGMLDRVQGSASFMGQEMLHQAPHRIARRGLAWVPEDRRIFTDLTVRENLDVGRQARRIWPDHSAAPFFDEARLARLFPNLAAMMDRPGAHMSGGEQQMLSVARTLMGNPFMVMLDEPAEGVAPLIADQMIATILELKRQGMSVLLSEQNVGFAEQVCDRVYLLEKGQICFTGSLQQLQQDDALMRSSLTM